jgi:hypothetical protein
VPRLDRDFQQHHTNLSLINPLAAGRLPGCPAWFVEFLPQHISDISAFGVADPTTLVIYDYSVSITIFADDILFVVSPPVARTLLPVGGAADP